MPHLREAARPAHDAGLDQAMADALLVRVRRSFNEEQESDPEKIELLRAGAGVPRRRAALRSPCSAAFWPSN